MRILPTTGRCMVNDHFSDVAGGTICSPLIWESTRFCLSPDVGDQAARISAAIMLSGCEVGLKFHLSHIILPSQLQDVPSQGNTVNRDLSDF